MSVQFSAPDPLDEELRLVLRALADRAAGRSSPARLERHRVDLEEEAGRRRQGRVLPGGAENEEAAKALAGEAACMANTPGGGALIVGAADDGTLLGTNLDTQWLRHRLYQLTDRGLTADAQEVMVAGTRLIVLRMHEALEPLRHGGRIRWRVDTNCVEIDAATWHARHLNRLGFDWSAQPSSHPTGAARATALQVARDYLRASNEPKALDLANATDDDLLRRLNAVTPDGYLTHAGALLFVGRASPALDYIRRDMPAGDSRIRINDPGRGLLEELAEVERAIAAHNPIDHYGNGLVIGQFPQLPPKTTREAIVNGLAHRDWNTLQPTSVEHVGPTLVVASPGGFVEGITPANIITHPSRSRNSALAIMLAALRVAEREGIGVDRMVRDMIRLGLAPPAIGEIDGPMVRTALVGGSPDHGWLDFLADITPTDVTDNLDVLLILRVLAEQGWVDATTVAPVLQRIDIEAAAALTTLEDARIHVRIRRAAEEPNHQSVLTSMAVIARVKGTPIDAEPVWCWTRQALVQLGRRGAALSSVAGRRRVAARFARQRGRISTTELSSITDVAPQHAGRTLKELEEQGELVPGRPERAGRGFFYRPARE